MVLVKLSDLIVLELMEEKMHAQTYEIQIDLIKIFVLTHNRTVQY